MGAEVDGEEEDFAEVYAESGAAMVSEGKDVDEAIGGELGAGELLLCEVTV